MSIVPAASEVVRALPIAAQARSWQAVLRTAVRDPVELCRLLELPPRFAAGASQSHNLFPVFAPRGYVARMERGNPHDPLLRQVLPLAEEHTSPAGFKPDPVGDLQAQRLPGLIQKYRGRALIVATGACAVHCRYCFRREFPYSDLPHSAETWQPVIDEIASDRSISEVILSGGDPLVLVDASLGALIERIACMEHVRRLRIHTRLPIMIPQRVTGDLLRLLKRMRPTAIVVVHANHPAELGGEVNEALGALVDAGIPVLNQSVLLKGVNDDVNVLAQLSEQLIDLRVMPYYLHQLDRVNGAAHFEVPVATGRRLIRELRRRLPGYAVPRYVREIAGAASKVPLV